MPAVMRRLAKVASEIEGFLMGRMRFGQKILATGLKFEVEPSGFGNGFGPDYRKRGAASDYQ